MWKPGRRRGGLTTDLIGHIAGGGQKPGSKGTPPGSVDGLRSSALGDRGGVVDGAEAPADVVVDHADVLHEGVHARGPDEAVPLRLQLLGERLRLRGRRG